MSVNIIAGPAASRGVRVEETFGQSTATVFRPLSLTTELSVLGGGSATGFEVQRYSLASGALEGQDKAIILPINGEANVYIAGTATGLHVFSAADDYVLARYERGKWRVIVSSATIATGT